MKVKCINNDNNKKRLTVGKSYTVGTKSSPGLTMTLIGKSGLYRIDHFVKLDGSRIERRDFYLNERYYPRTRNMNTYKYVKLKNNSKLKTLVKDVFYEVNYTGFWMGSLGGFVRIKDIEYNYHMKNFMFYNDVDYKIINRNKIITNLKEKLTSS